ncbi:septal ring lytic transglycosylase RlpA family protein [Methylomonas sp. CM2]|uniref:septal ring lytic transglycosylase RlpA family protein n=1 Tax=Methylomonas sp. CM2 TaxID=3417647 RepID=UPI003CF03CA2
MFKHRVAVVEAHGDRSRVLSRADIGLRIGRAGFHRANLARSISKRLTRPGLMLRRCVLALTVLAFAGCSLLPDLEESDDSANRPAGSGARYNRPYRVKGKTYVPLQSAVGYKERGRASWYGAESGPRTASGIRFDPRGLTAAHKTLPIPCKVRVTNLRNGRQVDVVITDRGPFAEDRLIDLSKAAAERIGMRGTAEVTIEYLGG